MSTIDKNTKINTLVLDAGPLITQSASQLQQYAHNFYTTPAVSDFAKLTGDYAVLSMNDIHIAALTYELECDLNNGPWRLRTYPGEKRSFDKKPVKADDDDDKVERETTKKDDDGWNQIPSKKITNTITETEIETEKVQESTTSEQAIKKKPRRRGGKRHRKKPQSEEAKDDDDEETKEEEEETNQVESEEPQIIPQTDDDDDDTSLQADYDDDEDDGEWITPENLQEEMLKDSNEEIETSSTESSKIKVALSTGDFAIQNISLQIGLNLMNSMSGLQIKRIRNYMYRCHACFTLTSIPKDGTPKHFCSSCGGATLLRCAVSINSKTGEIIPHLKKNFEWHKRGNIYSLSSPQSKNYAKKYGNQGFQHKGNSKLEQVYLIEDQKEYLQAIKNAKWQLKKNEKTMQEFVGGGSADNFISPFFTGNDNIKPVQVHVGKSRFVNSSRKKV
ncbi:hypothetical protein CANARDRAFT_8499 [[Candida] arabinofermentans NRRL YB-2248]|uniref:20S-pre-rRNA D-site endonuclease NOB1 n=1 Tax=[Candida] arabinofermentans NRRL YB-2248 TaxID=983967 RepID=A0A1E4SYF4_9ASCO|nr:hypothetical protein CANARDRAFT_8499 [[Candida] arabinofermentans NRRL YB-2248]